MNLNKEAMEQMSREQVHGYGVIDESQWNKTRTESQLKERCPRLSPTAEERALRLEEEVQKR